MWEVSVRDQHERSMWEVNVRSQCERSMGEVNVRSMWEISVRGQCDLQLLLQPLTLEGSPMKLLRSSVAMKGVTMMGSSLAVRHTPTTGSRWGCCRFFSTTTSCRKFSRVSLSLLLAANNLKEEKVDSCPALNIYIHIYNLKKRGKLFMAILLGWFFLFIYFWMRKTEELQRDEQRNCREINRGIVERQTEEL